MLHGRTADLSILLFLLRDEILISMSILSNEKIWKLLAILISMIELTENVVCRRFTDLVYLKLISKLLYLKITCHLICT